MGNALENDLYYRPQCIHHSNNSNNNNNMATETISELANFLKRTCPDSWQSQSKRMCTLGPHAEMSEMPTPTPTQPDLSHSQTTAPTDTSPSLHKVIFGDLDATSSWDTTTPNKSLDMPFTFTLMGEEPGKTPANVEESCKRSLDHFPCPDVCFPSPTLEFDFRVAVALKGESTQLQGKPAKEITALSSGSWSGSFGHGRVLAGGYDLGQARGFRPIRIVEGAFIMQTSDDIPATLEMRTRGSLSGPCDVLDALLAPEKDKDIDSRKYGFRMFLTVKTADKRYAEIVNCGLWVASGVWKGEELIIDAYRVT